MQQRRGVFRNGRHRGEGAILGWGVIVPPPPPFIKFLSDPRPYYTPLMNAKNKKMSV